MKNQYITTRNLALAAMVAVGILLGALLLSDGDPDLQGTAADGSEATAEVAVQPTDVLPTPVPTASPVPPTNTPIPPTATTEPSATNTDVPPTATTEPSATNTDVPLTETLTETATDEPPTATMTVTATTEPTTASGVSSSEIVVDEEPVQTGTRGDATGNTDTSGGVSRQAISCQMSITDAGDTNPFTFDFGAVNVQNIASYSWNFGDSTTSTSQSPSHTYTSTGTFPITLVCTPNSGSPITLSGSITVNSIPVASFSILPGTAGYSPFTVNLVNGSSGGGLGYSWSVTGPNSYTNSSTAFEPSFTFTDYGTYNITLTITDGAGTTAVATRTIAVNAPPPSADFTMSVSSGTAPLSVTFNGIDNSTGPITSWDWVFGDGTTATGQGPHTVIYSVENTYTITLNYSGPGGAGTVTKQVGVYPPAASVIADFVEASSTNSGATGVTVCFNNTSSGPITTNTWQFDFGSSPASVVDNGGLVCHTYATEGTYIIRLSVANFDGSATSQDQLTYSAWRSPTAAFTATANQIIWGQTVNFDSSGSTGVIVDYEWDFNNDGTIDSTDANPTGIALSTVGENLIRLRVRGPGGESTSEMIIVVARLDITCSITGATSALPGSSQAYNGVVGDLNGRTATYSWTVTGQGVNDSYTTQNINVTWGAVGSYLLTFTAQTADGASCSETTTVQVEYPDLTCSITGSINVVPDGNNVTYTATLNNVSGRTLTYEWYVDGAAQGVNSTTFTRSWTASANEAIRFFATTPDLSDDCEDTVNVVVAWPPLSCTMTGDFSPYPTGSTYTYGVNVTGALMGRTLTYEWFDAGNNSLGTSNTLDRSWTTPTTESLRVVVTPSDGTGCTDTRTITVAWPTPVCTISGNGSQRPDGNNKTFTGSVNDPAGRTYTYAWAIDGVDQGNATLSQIMNYISVGSHTITFTATPTNGTTGCTQTRTINFSWPNLTCTIPSPFVNADDPLPQMLDNPTRNYTFGMTVGGQAGRPIASYTWSGFTDGQATNTNSITLDWSASELGSYTVNMAVVVTNPDATTNTANCTRTFTVDVPAMTCAPPIGDLSPVIGETVNFQSSLTNQYARTTTYSWTLSEDDGFGNFTPVATGTNQNFSYQFNSPGVTYRIEYTADVVDPADNCSGMATVVASGTGMDFSCDAGPTGNLSPTNPATNYTYDVVIDNTNGYDLTYRWVLLDSGGNEVATLATNDSTVDGTITSPSISGNFIVNRVDDYTLRVYVDDTDDNESTYSCQLEAALALGTLNVTYSYTNSGGGAINNSLIEVGQVICFNNTSTVTHGTLADITFDWALGTAANSLGTATVNGETVSCFSFNTPGAYAVALNGASASGNRTGSHSVTFTVYGSQSIAVNYTQATLAPANINFSATGTNITGNYRWSFYNATTGALLNGTPVPGQNVARFFNTSGRYRAVVSGDGPLGTTQASVEFELLGANDIRAAFTPSTYGGLATLNVCFTDRSLGTTINSWTWDFGNGQTLTYNDTNIPAQICTDYTTPAQAHNVSLVVRNASSAQATATNVIRTYNQLESNSNFTITPQGGGSYCFTALVSPTVNVTSWDFGDGTIVTGNQTNICHSYQGVGTFLVTMFIAQGPDTGQITRPVDVSTNTSVPVPAIVATASCDANSVATFVLTNNGDSMTSSDQVKIVDQNGIQRFITSDLLLANGASRSFTVSFIAGTLTLTTVDTSVSTSTNCAEPPRLAGTAVCQANGSAVFTIENSGAGTAANQSYTITDVNGTVSTGTLNVAANNGTQAITVNNNYNALTFTSSGAQGPTTNLTLNADCDEPPVLAGTQSCALDGTITFNIANNSNDTASNQAYEIRDASNGLVQSGTLAIATGSSQTFNLSVIGEAEPLTFSTDGGAQGTTTVVSMTQTCDEPPILSGTASCAATGLMTFVINNASEDTAANQSYTIVDASNATVASGTLTAAAGGSQSFDVNIIGVNDPLTFSSSDSNFGANATVNVTHDCDEPPILSTTASCAVTGMLTFTVDNTSANTAANQPYEIRDGNNVMVNSGTLNVAVGGSTDISVSVINTGDPLTFSTSDPVFGYGSTATSTATQNCDEPPILIAGSACSIDGAAIYTVRNDSEDTAASQTYQVTRGGVVVDSGTLSINPGITQTVIVQTGDGALTFTSNGAQGTTTSVLMNTNCSPRPQLYGTAICQTDGTVVFDVNNGGGLVTQPYQIVDGSGVVVDSGSMTIAGNGTQQFTVPNASGTLSFSTTGVSNLTMDASCGNVSAAAVAGLGINANASLNVNAAGMILPRLLPAVSLVPGDPDPGIERAEAWDGIEMGGAICPDWIIYHTDQTGDWEVFRLGDLPDGRVADVNLSQGRGDDVVDMAPTRSPDAEWVAFTSNRDGNWELYVAKVDNSIIRRVTYNVFAPDIDPVWSPDGRYLAFETSRDGNWELYLFDLITGQEIRLTEDDYSDINAFWSPDSERLLFQSDRSGQWQIYELNISTLETTLMSDGEGEDHDAAYSSNGDYIVFRSFRDEGNHSVVYIMNNDGTGLERVSDPNANAMNHTWSPDDSVIAYQSDLDGDLDIYAWEEASRETRLVTDNDIPDYAPTWICYSTVIVFTSDVTEDPNIFNTPALPIDADPIIVDEEATQMTFDPANDVYPESSPSEENASQEGDVPPRIN
ncbi:MAG: PKD domain-containing protein [Aggregatilineales bacterium]